MAARDVRICAVFLASKGFQNVCIPVDLFGDLDEEVGLACDDDKPRER
jgi:hypothetical protein